MHDRRAAQISHLPHLLAVALVNSTTPETQKLAGGGFRDMTRIASGSPELWTEILSANADAVARELHQFTSGLRKLKGLLQNPDRPALKSALLATLKAAHDARSQIPEKRPPHS
jgi:prephenate dehydrogenase